ncbi:MAG: MotA/TolQ/ExbB proton channel family protein [Candidatus Riflebacteria bacterium]|nr:MotA/TolQ/ExbB proton channel family protein [Candidatus Riflebacteria bacterium]
MLAGFIHFIGAGGPVMYPLTLTGILIFTLGFYQVGWLLVWTLSSNRYACAGAPRWAKKAIDMAAHKTGLAGLSLLESIELCFSRMEDCLTRRVPAMRFLAQVSTLMGFLGTVTGMVNVFNTVARLGMVTPGDLAGGIHEALFTTVYGLILALIAWGFTYLIEALSRRHLSQLEMLVFAELENSAASEVVAVGLKNGTA